MKNICSLGIANNAEETIKFGKKIADLIEPGDVVKLYGNLGAGKTTFMKGVLSALGYKGVVTSPTYTLINEYDITPKVIHIDCYREGNLKRWHMLGIEEYFNNNLIVFIEWPEILETILPIKNCYDISFNFLSENKREIKFI